MSQTRLDRILNLLATGSNASVKATAARQLGSIAAQASRSKDEASWVEIIQLLTRILPFLHHKQWETRVAAGKAFDAVCVECGTWQQPETTQVNPRSSAQSALDTFNLSSLLAGGNTLLASSGNEYKNVSSEAGSSKKKEMLSNLGLAGFGDDAFLDDELAGELDIKPEIKVKSEVPVAGPSSQPMEDEAKGLSARERNALKRKRKADSKGPPATKLRLEATPDASPSSSSAPPEPVVIAHKTATKVDPTSARPELDLYLPLANEWPFTKLCAYLSSELLNSAWETRHGSALGLLGILKSQGTQAGLSSADDSDHSIWIQNLTTQVLRVLCLDRFGDYVGDSVVAPVRETASMLLACCLRYFDAQGSAKVLKVLMDMVRQQTGQAYVWQVRHAGLVGLKYLVAVLGSSIQEQEALKSLLEVAFIGLQDMDDDVRSAAAATLNPLAATIVDVLPDQITPLLQILWDALADLKDDLSHSVGGIMELLSSLLAHPKVMVMIGSSLPTLCPLLYPHFRHTITSVRLEVLKTMQIFLSLNASWIDGRALCLLFQNVVLEEKAEVRNMSANAFLQAVRLIQRDSLLPLVINWLNIALTPLGTPFNDALFLKTEGIFTAGGSLDRAVMRQDLSLVSEERLIKGRLSAAHCLAQVAIQLPDEHRDSALLQHLATGVQSSPSAFQRSLIAIILEEIALAQPELVSSSSVLSGISTLIQPTLEAAPPATYIETAGLLATLQTDCQALYSGISNTVPVPQDQMPQHSQVFSSGAFTLGSAQASVGSAFAVMLKSMNTLAKGKAKAEVAKVVPRLEEKRNKILIGIDMCTSLKEKLDIQLYASLAGTLVAFNSIPNKLNPLIKSIMNSVKFEENLDLQTRSASSLALFIQICTKPDTTVRVNPSDKLVKNLCTFLCQDVDATPIFAELKKTEKHILSLPDPAPDTKGKTGKKIVVAQTEVQIRNKRVRRGAEIALGKLCDQFGAEVVLRLPKLWSCMSEAIVLNFDKDDAQLTDDQKGQDVLDNLTVLASVSPRLHESLQPQISQLFVHLARAVKSNFAVIRQAAARCITSLCAAMPTIGLRHVVLDMLPALSDPLHSDYRRGTIELISYLVNELGLQILPYVIFLVVPVLGRMTDADQDVRAVATTTFASLIRLVPLEAGIPDPVGFSEEVLAKRNTERQFLVQLLDGSKIENYELSVPIKAELRKYQKEGVSWLAFLAKFQLHGILCDDMGLGKTLQTICILASQTHDRAEAYARTKSPEHVHLPSLVICPPTLTGHWVHEIQTYSGTLRPVLYTGDKAQRARILATREKIDVLVMSYDVARNDIANVNRVQFNYCVLDEGHIIKNGKTKLSQALKTIQANHRVILSGTPIQNNLLELWSLFDFLMPGFLGTEKSFNERYSKPVQASREAKSSSREQEAGTLALDALHKQVLPFLLRRLKEDVLDDLPPKIIQDYHCDLSPLQSALYDEHSRSEAGGGKEENQHVFQSLQYLRKLVNHPLLVVKPDQPSHLAILRKFQSADSSFNLRDVNHAPKLVALRQILQDCGIGKTDDSADDAIAPHRVLIFCQMKQMLDIIENDLFRLLMPSVTYMRMDGATPTGKRHAVVQTFNADPSIDVLLMTTHVGGLGLNLTGADTVIFVEHDWNPMKDLQAMDRAHRLGQKRVVNVYRLITRGTLEEKIMGLQRFKLNIASSVITQQNANLSSMDTDQVLDLFDVASNGDTTTNKKQKKITQKELLEGLGDLQEDEYGFEGAESFAAGL